MLRLMVFIVVVVIRYPKFSAVEGSFCMSFSVYLGQTLAKEIAKIVMDPRLTR